MQNINSCKTMSIQHLKPLLGVVASYTVIYSIGLHASRGLFSAINYVFSLKAWFIPGTVSHISQLLSFLPATVTHCVATGIEETLFSAIQILFLKHLNQRKSRFFTCCLIITLRILYFWNLGLISIFFYGVLALHAVLVYLRSGNCFYLVAGHLIISTIFTPVPAITPIFSLSDSLSFIIIFTATISSILLLHPPTISPRISLTLLSLLPRQLSALDYLIAVLPLCTMFTLICDNIGNALSITFPEAFNSLSEVFKWDFTRLGLLNIFLVVLASIWFHLRFKTADCSSSKRNVGFTTKALTALFGIFTFFFIASSLFSLTFEKASFIEELIYSPPAESLNADSSTLFTSFGNVPLYVVSVVLGGAEEIFFTGFFASLLFRFKQIPPQLSIIIYVATRVIVHQFYGIYALFNIPAWALFAAIYYYRSRKLWPLVFGHILTNFIQFYPSQGDLHLVYYLTTYLTPTCSYLGFLLFIAHFSIHITSEKSAYNTCTQNLTSKTWNNSLFSKLNS